MTQQPSEPARRAEETASVNGRSEWFYVQRGETYGPVSSADLSAAAHLGFLGPDDLVRRSGRTNWVLARSIPGLFIATRD